MRFITNQFHRILRNALISPAKKMEENFHFSSFYFRSKKSGNHGRCSIPVKGRFLEKPVNLADSNLKIT